MRQLIQDASGGALRLADVPPPALAAGALRVRTYASVISAGTERMMIELGRASLLGKARQRPDLVKRVLDKARKEGIASTVQMVRARLGRPTALGYSAAGIVEAVGSGLDGTEVGRRVAVAGAGYANHAEVNCVPRNLTAEVPEGLALEEAAYATIASIALQGVRLARPELGDHVAVIGLGLIGLIAMQLLRAQGCRVIGLDVNPRRLELGHRLGMDGGACLGDGDPLRAVEAFTRGRGADHVLIAAATKSNQPVELAGEIARRKGQVVAVGAVGMEIPRTSYYEKELSFQVSMSYGPGRYDPSYEEGGIDYPYDYVRWTEQRNLEAVLDLMARGLLNVRELTTHRFPFERALDAYRLIDEGREEFAGIVLEYPAQAPGAPEPRVVEIRPGVARPARERLGVAFVGAGNYALAHLLPHLRGRDVELRCLVGATGPRTRSTAERYGFARCATELDAALEDDGVHAVFIATRHALHAELVARALRAGRHVFVEKPLVVSEEQLAGVREAHRAGGGAALMVGLNRRFAPMVSEAKEALRGAGALQMIYRVNSGPIPPGTWTHEPEEGGGMLVGEMCHFLDLMQFLAGEQPVSVFARALRAGSAAVCDADNVSIVVGFRGGSVGTLCYNTVGDKAAPKERLEVYGGGAALALDDFRSLEVTRGGRRRRRRAANQDKGQAREMAATLAAFRAGGPSPIPFAELAAGMAMVFAARRSLAEGGPVSVEAEA
jgi:predicted dehydrogenase/threonine dehydrogenase-like Zn-dependent dehydrogenase